MVSPPCRPESATDPASELRVERVVAWSRIALIAGSLVGTFLDTTEPQFYARAAYAVLVVYGVLALAAAAWIERAGAASARFIRGASICDLVMAGLLISLTAGPGSPLFPLFTFVLAAAAFRDGSRAVYPATMVLLTLLVGGAVVTWMSSGQPLTSVNFLIVRTTYLLVIAFLLGRLADEERRLRRETSLTARALGRIRDARTHMAALTAVAEELGRAFGVSRVIALFEDADGVDYAWKFIVPTDARLRSRFEPLALAERPACWFPVPEEVQAWSSRSGPQGVVSACPPITVGGPAPAGSTPFAGPPPPFWDTVQCRSVMGLATVLGQEWRVRVYLLDPATRLPPTAALALFQFVTLQVAPALLNTQLVSRLRSNAVVAERERLSRELHDRVVQSLIAIEMQLSALGRQAGSGNALLPRVMAVRDSLRSEIGAVRELMHDLRPVEIDGGALPAYLGDVVARFGRDTGIQASFSSDAAALDVSSRRCGELARIVQEALVNVRKHSGATDVRVGLAATSAGVTLHVEDNGRGFGFSGRLSDEELRRQRRGPVVIQQRARRIGASLSIDSRPGRGSRLDLVLPCAS